MNANGLSNRELANALAQTARGGERDKSFTDHYWFGPYGLFATAARRIDQLENFREAVTDVTRKYK
jgi:hypothetical protein